MAGSSEYYFSRANLTKVSSSQSVSPSARSNACPDNGMYSCDVSLRTLVDRISGIGVNNGDGDGKSDSRGIVAIGYVASSSSSSSMDRGVVHM